MSQDTLFEKIAAEIVDRIYVMFIDDQQLPEGETTEEQKIAVVLKIMRPLRALPSGYVQVPNGWRALIQKFRDGCGAGGGIGVPGAMNAELEIKFCWPLLDAIEDGLTELEAATPTPSDTKPGEQP